MSALGLIVALCITQADAGVQSDAGVSSVPFSDALYATCPEAPLAEERDGGTWLPTPRAARVACLMMTCETARTEQAKQLVVQPVPQWVLQVTSIAVAVGAAMFGVGRISAATCTPTPTSPCP